MAKYVNVPEHARGVSYGDEDYAETLARLFNNSLSREDILDSLGSPWVSVSKETINTTGNNLVLKNLSDNYYMYLINIHGLLVDSTAGQGDLRIQTSEDNGATFDTAASDYANIRWEQDTATMTDDYGADPGIVIFPALSTHDELHSDDSVGAHATVQIKLYGTMDTNTTTTLEYWAIVSDTSGNFAMSRGQGHRRAKEANNAIRLITSANSFDAGSYDVYGLRRVTN